MPTDQNMMDLYVTFNSSRDESTKIVLCHVFRQSRLSSQF